MGAVWVPGTAVHGEYWHYILYGAGLEVGADEAVSFPVVLPAKVAETDHTQTGPGLIELAEILREAHLKTDPHTDSNTVRLEESTAAAGVKILPVPAPESPLVVGGIYGSASGGKHRTVL